MESSRTTSVALSVALGLLGLAAPAPFSQLNGQRARVDAPKEAVAVLSATKGNVVAGVLLLTAQGGSVHVRGEVSGLEPGKHRFHIHQFGDVRDLEGTSAGGHFNPGRHRHGGPQAAKRHAGDLGAIEANQNGVAVVDKTAVGVPLQYVIGRALVVHAGADDRESQPSGDAGSRVALGVIGYAQVEPEGGPQGATAERAPSRAR